MLLSLREQLLRVLSLLIVIGLIVPPPAVWAVTPTIEPPVTLPLSGSLRYPIELDGDRVPTTNPIGLPVPVERFGAVDRSESVLYATVQLGVEVVPTDAAQNPAGTPVTLRLWNNTAGSGKVDLTREVRADAWGAAFTDFLIDDLHLLANTPYYYQASAPGFGSTEVRSFTFDLNRFSSDMQVGAAHLQTRVETDGRLIVDITSDLPIAEALNAAEIMAVRITPTADPAQPQRDVLPPLLAQRLDDHHARAAIYLEAGHYALLAQVRSGTRAAHSLPVMIAIDRVTPPPVTAVENILSIEPDGRSGLVQYRTPDGDVALLHRALNNLPAIQPPPAASRFTQVTRLSAFKLLKEDYQIDVNVIADDKKKLVTVDGFHYDPIERRYDIAIQSLMEQAVDDKLTVQVFGPNQVVIYEETVPIRLQPDRLTRHSVVVPTDRGEPYGLRVIVHDPAILDWLVEKTDALIMGLYQSLLPDAQPGLDSYALFGVKVEFKVVEILLLGFSKSCTAEQCADWEKDGILFKDPADWPDILTQGVRDFLRNNFGAGSIDEALWKLLLEGLTLGSASLAGFVTMRLAYNTDTACLTREEQERVANALAATARGVKDIAALINLKLKPTLEKWQGDGKWKIPIQTWLELQIAPIAAFSFDAGSTETSISADLQFQLGVSGSFVLKPLGALKLVELLGQVRQVRDDVQTFQQVVELARGAGTALAMIYRLGGLMSNQRSSCSTPPPNGHPDDRLDPIEDQFLSAPTGVSGDVANYQQQLAVAQQLSLARASTYWTLRLRQSELAQFNADTARALDEQAAIDALTTQTEGQLQGLISGAIPITPSQTITDAVMSTLANYYDGLGHTAYDQERQLYLDALAFAERQYQQLRGQELELQRELRLMLQTGGIGVIDEGLASWTLGALGSLGVTGVPVQLLPGVSTTRAATSRYYSPYEAPKVVLVPSGGLERFVNSDHARDWLATYTASGGTLIVLAQRNSADWELLPGGQVKGLGYDQDILCKYASVQIVNPSEWIVGLSRNLPDLQLDGSFTSVPPNATIILRRTTGNLMPAMIEYAYGNGRVIATSAYPDFYMNGQQSPEDVVFARSLFGQAYLLSVNQTPQVTAPASSAVALSFALTNTTALTATFVKVDRDFYTQGGFEAWRWAAHKLVWNTINPVPLNPPLPSGASRVFTAAFVAPQTGGLYRLGHSVGITLSTSGVLNSPMQAGPFYRVEPPNPSGLLAAPLSVQLTRDQSDYLYGTTAAITATLINHLPDDRSLHVEVYDGISANPIDLTLPGGGIWSSVVYTTTVYDRRLVYVRVHENGDLLSDPVMSLDLRPPSLGLVTAPTELVAGLAATVNVTATSSSALPNLPVTFRVSHNGSIVISTTVPLIGNGQLAEASVPLALPAFVPGDVIVVEAELPDQTMSQVLPVRQPVALSEVKLPAYLQLGEINPQAVPVVVKGNHAGSQVAAQALLQHAGATLTTGPITTATLNLTSTTLLLDVTLPYTLDTQLNYTLVVSATGQAADGSPAFNDTLARPLSLLGPQLLATTAQWVPGQPMGVLLHGNANSRLAAPSAPYTITLQHVTRPVSQTLVVTGTLASASSTALAWIVPLVPAPGMYHLTITSARLPDWQAATTGHVPARTFTYTAPSSVNAGGAITWSIHSPIDFLGPMSGTLSLLDLNGTVLAQQAVNTTLAGSNRTVTVTLPVPAQIKTGAYHLLWQGRDDMTQAIVSRRALRVEGITAGVATHTDRAAYLPTDLVTSITTVTAQSPLTAAQLRLQVIKPIDQPQLISTTVAGALPGSDGLGFAARLYAQDIAVSPNGAFAVFADPFQHVIGRYDLATGEVKTIAGQKPDVAGTTANQGHADGIGSAATFKSPAAIAIDPTSSYALIGESEGYVRRLDLSTYQVTTPITPAVIAQAGDFAFSADGSTVYIADQARHVIWRMNPISNTVTVLAGGLNTPGLVNATGTAARFRFPSEIVLSPNGALAYILDSDNRVIRRMTVPTATVTTQPMNYTPLTSNPPFNSWTAYLAVSKDGQHLLVSEPIRDTLSMLNVATGAYTLVAGAIQTQGYVDGVGAAVRFNAPFGLSQHPTSTFALITDNDVIRRIEVPASILPTTTLTVTSLAGLNWRLRDGVGAAARLRKLPGLAVSSDGTFALAVDDVDHTVRRIDLLANEVTTLAGLTGISGSADGYTTTARFNRPTGIVIEPDNTGALILDTGNYLLRRIDLNTGYVSTLVGATGLCNLVDGVGTAARLCRPEGIALSGDGSFVVIADTGNFSIRRIDRATLQVTTLAGIRWSDHVDGIGPAARFTEPRGIALSPDDSYALIADMKGPTIRRLNLSMREVTTIAGQRETVWSNFTSIDNVGRAATFDRPERIALSPDGTYALISEDGVYGDALRRLNLLTGRVQTLARRAHTFSTNESVWSYWNGLAFGPAGTFALAAQWDMRLVDNAETVLRQLDTAALRTTGLPLAELWQPVAGSGALSFTRPFTDLLSQPQARGQLLLQATLFSVEPTAEISPALRHVLGAQTYPFVVADVVPLGLYTPQADHMQGSGPLTLYGAATNSTTMTTTVIISVTRNTTVTLFNEAVQVPPQTTQLFSVIDANAPLGNHTYTARSSEGLTATTSVNVVPTFISAVADTIVAHLTPGRSAEVQVRLTNSSYAPADVSVNFGPQAGLPTALDVTIGAQRSVSVTQIVTPGGLGIITVPITISGAFNGTINAVFNVGHETPIVSTALRGLTRTPSALVQTADAAIDLMLQNSLTWPYDVNVAYSIGGADTRSGSAALTLPPGLTTQPITLNLSAPGSYTAIFTVTHAALGHSIVTSRTFDLVAPRYDVFLTPDVQPTQENGDAAYLIVIDNSIMSEGAVSGELILAGAVITRAPIALAPGQGTFFGDVLNVQDRSGAQEIEARVVLHDGTPLVTRTFTIDAAPRLAPEVTLNDLTASFDETIGRATITVTLDNLGRAGDADLTLNAFDEAYDWLVAVPANETVQAQYVVPMAGGVLSGTYPIEVRLADQSLRTEVFIPGSQIAVAHQLDAETYLPGSPATWTVVLTGTQGAVSGYDVIMRYNGVEHVESIFVGTGDVVTVTWPLTTALTGERATLLVNAPTMGGSQAVLIDSQWVNVIEDPRARLTANTTRANAGEIISLTLWLTPTRLAAVFAPDSDGLPGTLLWSSLSYTNTGILSGTFGLTYTLPAVMSSGRYYFRYTYDGEERTLPLDVDGIELHVRDLQVKVGSTSLLNQVAAATPVNIAAQVETPQSLSNIVIEAYARTPDGQYLNLGGGAIITTNLTSGVNDINLNGLLTAVQPGTQQIILEVRHTTPHLTLDSAALYFDAGAAIIDALTTSQGLYTPNEAAHGTLTLYGRGLTQVRVTTSDGAPLLTQAISLTGFVPLTFTLPTTTERDEVIIATLTDTLGFTATQQAAYKVAVTLDITAPQVMIVSPASGSLVSFTDSHHLVTVSGLITEDRAIDQVLINGQPAAITGSTFTATLPLDHGANLFEVVAIDRASNIGLGKLYSLYGQPSFGISLSAAPTNVGVGQPIVFTAQITSTDQFTGTVLFPFSARFTRSNGSVVTGALTLTDTVVRWEGTIALTQPVTIQWTGTATQTFTTTAFALVQAEQILPRVSNALLLDITGGLPPSQRLYLPLIRR